MQQPPSGETRVGNTCEILKSMTKLYLQSITKLYIASITGRMAAYYNTTGRVSRCLKPTVWTVEHSVSGVLYISSLLRSSSSRSGKASRIVDFRVESSLVRFFPERRLFDHAGHANCRVESPLARGSPDAATSTRWDLGRHDRSCLEMSEADGVDGGAICKRGFIHLQFAEKLEAPEAERHLGSWILE
ncbi:hypothetical protein V1477_018480 [Vespula maculifrons]|uniref:Uncharacterized protein n=1 Tax=Vespula maculifrons TaxID=7453 RepID=A0ABD2AVH3_VESMC